MAGILANSASVSMVSGDTAASKNMFGYAKTEAITLGVTPAGTSWVWAMVPPSASLARTARLSSTTVAAPTFTPDVDGTYVITCMVDGTTSYTIHCVVVNETTAVQVPHVTWTPKAPADVVAPAGGLRQFYNSATSLMAFKDSDGNVTTAVIGTATAAPVGITPGATAAAGASGLAADYLHTHAVPAFGTVTGTFCEGQYATNDRTASVLRTATGTVSVSAAAAPVVGRPLLCTTGGTGAAAGWTGDMDLGGGVLTNFRSGGSAADVPLSTDAATAVATWVCPTLDVSSRYVVTFGARERVWSAAAVGTIDCEIDVLITTNGAGVPTLSFQTTPVPNTDRLPTGFAPTMTLTVATTTLTINATRPAGVACKAFAAYWFQPAEKLAAI